MIDECIHDLDPATCSTCKHPRRQPHLTYGEPFRAQFDGQCHGCNLPIHSGQLIASRTASNDSDVTYVHQGCE